MSEVNETDKKIINEVDEVIELTEEQLDAILAELGEFEEDRLDDVPDKLFNERYIYLNGSIEPETIDEIVPMIHYYNSKDDNEEIPISKRKHIKLFLNTQGGCVYSTLNIYEEIKASKTPIEIVLSGIAMSGGLILFLSSPYRSMKDTATLLYHEARTDHLGGTIEEIERTNFEFKRLQKMCDELIVKETKVTQKQLNKYKGKVKDWYIGKSDALKYGFISQ